MVDYKHCQIVKTETGQYILSGAKRTFGSLRELMNFYQKEALRSDGYTFQLTRCCPPTLKGQCEIHSAHTNLTNKLKSGFKPVSILTPVLVD